MRVRAISLWEPWATAMALELKRNETRSRPTSYRGDLVICSAKRKMPAEDRETYDICVAPHATAEDDPALHYGHALCVVELYECVPTGEFHGFPPARGTLDLGEIMLGDYTPGRWAWMTRNCRRLKPFPVVGRQGLWLMDLPEQPPMWVDEFRVGGGR